MYVPMGVPGFGGGDGGVLLLPPPQPGTNIIRINSAKKPERTRSRPLPARKIEPSTKVPAANKLAKRVCLGACSMAVGAVVVTFTTAEVVWGDPLAIIVEGVKVQAASEGRPEQARVIVPLKPVEYETVKDACPEPPGAEIINVDGAGFVA